MYQVCSKNIPSIYRNEEYEEHNTSVVEIHGTLEERRKKAESIQQENPNATVTVSSTRPEQKPSEVYHMSQPSNPNITPENPEVVLPQPRPQPQVEASQSQEGTLSQEGQESSVNKTLTGVSRFANVDYSAVSVNDQGQLVVNDPNIFGGQSM